MTLNNKNLYTASLASSLLGVFLLLTEDFGAWQDRDPFYGVREGFVCLGSQRARVINPFSLKTIEKRLNGSRWDTLPRVSRVLQAMPLKP